MLNIYKKVEKMLPTILRTLIVFILFYYGIVFIRLLIIKLFGLNTADLTMNMRVLLSTISSIILMGIYYIIYRKELIKEFKIFKKDLINNIDIGFKYWFIGLVIMIVSNLFLTIVLHSNGAENENIVQQAIDASPWIMLISGGFIGPFNEEIVFRKSIKDVFKNKWIFIIISALLFGGAHIVEGANTLVDYLYIIPYGALGGAFALCYYKTKTIFTSMFMHMFHNTALILLAILPMFS